jgi:hypothetical protein
MLQVTREFISICEWIAGQRRTDAEWATIESSDMFQSKSFCGGYDADEAAFCFSYYNADGCEFWFQVTLIEVADILNGRKTDIDLRSPESQDSAEPDC